MIKDIKWVYNKFIIENNNINDISVFCGISESIVIKEINKHCVTFFNKKSENYNMRNSIINKMFGDKIKYNLYKKFSKFVNEASKIHNNKYEYISYDFNNKKKGAHVIINCPKHGYFVQKTSSHLSGKGCKKCFEESLLLTIDKFIKRSMLIHGNKYDYSLVNLINGRSSIVKIICKKHGIFEQKADSHLRGHGCKKCSNEFKRSSHENFISKVKKVHGNSLIVKSKYKTQWDDVLVKCKIHGNFYIKPNRLLYKSGCPKCYISYTKPHKQITELIERYDKVHINDRKIIYPYEIDIVTQKFGIEVHGIYWHSYNKKESKKEKYRHWNKASDCFDKNFLVLQIFENEWYDKKEIITSIIKNKLGISCKIYARKCNLIELKSKDFNDFMDNNHLYGKLNTKVKYGLVDDKYGLVLAIGFNYNFKNGWEITRIASKSGFVVIGGVSKIFNRFKRDFSPKIVLSYSDRRYSFGNIYKKLGFKLDSITNPGYFYVKNYKIYSRQQFQKHKLSKKLHFFDINLSESQNMFNNGYRRLWDAGHFKFIWESKI